MSETHEYDVVVIGAGPVGENVAQYAIEGTDLTAALVEGELYGGECSYWACIPSKALLRPIAVADTTAHLQGWPPPRSNRRACSPAATPGSAAVTTPARSTGPRAWASRPCAATLVSSASARSR